MKQRCWWATAHSNALQRLPFAFSLQRGPVLVNTSSPWIKPGFGGAAIDDGNAADEPSGPWASGVQPPADRGLACT